MKIVHSCTRYYPYFGGIETHVRNVSERMAKLGHDVLVYTTDPSGKLPSFESINGVSVYRFKLIHPNDVYFFSSKLFLALWSVKCDIMHGHDLHTFPLLSVTQSRGSRRRIATLHVGGSSSYYRNLLRLPYDGILMHYLLRRVEKIVCVSESEMQLYSRITRLPTSKFVFMPNGTDFSGSNFDSSKKNFRFILSVGRLEKSKGFQYLIKSYSMICREKELEDVSLIIIGNGPYKNNLIKLVNELGIEQKVEMLENVPQERLKRLYQDCDAFVLLSKYESQSIAIVDALAMHKPVITTKQGVREDYVRKGYCIGVDWPPDPLKVAKELEYVLKNKGIKPTNYLKTCSWDDVTERLLFLYDDVLSGKQLF